jgi:mono/diheme cytochrome c family protein
MKLKPIAFLGVAGVVVFIGASLFAEDAKSSNAAVTTKPVYVPDTSHASERLADGVLAWDNTMKETNAPASASNAYFVFSFTNVSPGNVVILDVHTSCGCTTAQLPPRPWTLPAGTNGQIGVNVNFAGKSGTLLKTVTVTADKGTQTLMVKINILPPVMPTLSEADRARGIEISKTDRQAVFRGDCATCHVKPGQGKYGKLLFDADCAICHEGEHRATMVPDLHAIKVPTNVEFWRMWITHGKPGSLMPAFSTAESGPLTDIQISSLANYLAAMIPSQVAPPPAQ